MDCGSALVVLLPARDNVYNSKFYGMQCSTRSMKRFNSQQLQALAQTFVLRHSICLWTLFWLLVVYISFTSILVLQFIYLRLKWPSFKLCWIFLPDSTWTTIVWKLRFVFNNYLRTMKRTAFRHRLGLAPSQEFEIWHHKKRSCRISSHQVGQFDESWSTTMRLQCAMSADPLWLPVPSNSLCLSSAVLSHPSKFAHTSTDAVGAADQVGQFDESWSTTMRLQCAMSADPLWLPVPSNSLSLMNC